MFEFLNIRKSETRILNWMQYWIWNKMCLIKYSRWCPKSSSSVGTRIRIEIKYVPIYKGFSKFHSHFETRTQKSKKNCANRLWEIADIEFSWECSLKIPSKLMLSLAFHNHIQQNHTVLEIPFLGCFSAIKSKLAACPMVVKALIQAMLHRL